MTNLLFWQTLLKEIYILFFSAAMQKNVRVELVNTSGQVLYSRYVNAMKGNNEIIIEGNNFILAPGYYLLQVKLPGSVITKQLIITK
jgi:hypothetical protein